MVSRTVPDRILLTGATGSIGGRLLPGLLGDRQGGAAIRALVRDPARARLPEGVETAKGDVFAGEGLDAALEGVDVAYYLIHAMGRGNKGDFADLDRRGAWAFGEAAERAGVRRIVYLGGLGGKQAEESHHLQSRAEVAKILARHVPEPVHARAAMVIAPDSQSFVILKHLVDRLPVMVCPKWVSTRSQPIAARDVTAALLALSTVDDVPGEVQLGGAEVLTYREMMLRTADALERRRPPMVPVPFMTPRLSSLWVSLFGGVEYPLVRPLVEGLRAEMIVTAPPPDGVNDAPLGFDAAVAEALADD
ncbi:NAD(P)H-binding protein [Patulibacter minatonensis]|uniref:NAD(P)H-binding protein n=1 Tax=Patulibacter minatonensis TaxID=298163 RepID=UPI000688297D|nr:NAD(P)H-binding protein [Patulibacter minatonensis]